MASMDSLNQVRSNINVTPLIDVLLVLLVIFMIVTPILTKAMDSDIPQKSEQTLPQAQSDQQLVLSITADARYLLNRDEVSLLQIPQRLREVFAARGGRRLVFVNAEDSVRYGVVVQLMDLCRGAGAEHVGIVTETLEAPADTPAVPVAP